MSEAQVARLVADHWRRAALVWDNVPMAHALCCVLAALDGETDLADLGFEPLEETRGTG